MVDGVGGFVGREMGMNLPKGFMCIYEILKKNKKPQIILRK